eukprot:1678810-Pyramimonas_sp.AAC.2
MVLSILRLLEEGDNYGAILTLSQTNGIPTGIDRLQRSLTTSNETKPIFLPPIASYDSVITI